MMYFRKYFAVFLLIFFSLLSTLSANGAHISTAKGINLSNDIYSFLKKNQFTPSTQALVNNGTNAFPYNISVDFYSQNKSDKNLVLVFSQEQIENKKKIILDVLNNIKNNDFNCNISVLFTYGDNQTIEKKYMICGSEVYISSLNTNEDYTCLIFDLDNTENKVITCSNGLISPSWLIKNSYNIYLKENLNKNLPFYYVSQIYTTKLFKDRQLESFLQNNISSIKLCLNSSFFEDEKTSNIILNSIQSYNDENIRNWENHFLLINFFGHYLILTENVIIRIIIFIIFSWLLYVFILGFVNIRVKNNAIFKLKKIWYSIPLTFGLSYLSFICGRFIFSIFPNSFSPILATYICCVVQIGIAFLFATIFYLLMLLFNFKFSQESVDFLIVVVCFLNQAIFILVDISLFPVFLVFFILAVFSYYIKNNVTHIIIFFLMILALVPYANTVVINGNHNILYQYVLEKYFTPIVCSLAIYPIFLLYFRILTSLKNYFKTNRSLIIFNFAAYFFIIISLTIFATVRGKLLSSKYSVSTNYEITKIDDEKIKCLYSDKYIFNDIIRTVEIELDDEPEVCEVRINSLRTSPVLYSDNEYESISNTATVFKIPDNPPNKLTFVYGAPKEPSNIVINALYQEKGTQGRYNLVTKVISIGDN